MNNEEENVIRKEYGMNEREMRGTISFFFVEPDKFPHEEFLLLGDYEKMRWLGFFRQIARRKSSGEISKILPMKEVSKLYLIKYAAGQRKLLILLLLLATTTTTTVVANLGKSPHNSEPILLWL